MNLFGKIKSIFVKDKKPKTANFNAKIVFPELKTEQIFPPQPIQKKKHFRFSHQVMISKQKSQQKNWSKWKNR